MPGMSVLCYPKGTADFLYSQSLHFSSGWRDVKKVCGEGKAWKFFIRANRQIMSLVRGGRDTGSSRKENSDTFPATFHLSPRLELI